MKITKLTLAGEVKNLNPAEGEDALLELSEQGGLNVTVETTGDILVKSREVKLKFEEVSGEQKLRIMNILDFVALPTQTAEEISADLDKETKISSLDALEDEIFEGKGQTAKELEEELDHQIKTCTNVA